MNVCRNRTNKMTASIAAILLAVISFSCTTKKSSEQNEISSDSTTAADKNDNKSLTTDSVKTESFDYSNCIRGNAESVIKKAVYPNSIFKLNSDNHTGTEVVDLGGGEKVIIRNWGCEYFVLTFRFETQRFQADTVDVKFWLEKAVILMKGIEIGLEAPLNINGGTVAVEKFLKKNRDYSLGEEIVYNDDVIRDFVTFDRVQEIGKRRFAIEISYARGPL